MKNITVTTLGIWSIIPELYGFINPQIFDLYKNSSNLSEINLLRESHHIKPADEIWFVGTSGNFAEKAIGNIEDWKQKLNIKTKFRFFMPTDIDDPISIEECKYMSNLIYTVVYNAKKECNGGQLILSLAGGRKTMSADLQEAAYTFGCDIVLHIASKNDISLRDFKFTEPFPKEKADLIMPIISFSNLEANSILYTQKIINKLSDYDFKDIDIKNRTSNSTKFYDFIEKEKKKARNFIYNISEPMYGDSKQSNFTALYLLHPAKIKKLKNLKFGINPNNLDNEFEILKLLPKTELHCHLGGVLNAKDMIRIAMANIDEINLLSSKFEEYKEFLKNIKKLVDDENLDILKETVLNIKDLRTKFKSIKEPYNVLGFISCFKNNSNLLDEFVFGSYREENKYFRVGIEAYEKLGDLQGSGILQNETSIRECIKILIKKTKEHNVKYLEVRCSPANYTRGGLSKEDVYDFIVDELGKDESCDYSIIFIASRHGKKELIMEHIELAKNILINGNKGKIKLTGFDVAGNEKAKTPAELRNDLEDIMKECLKITIHAGETAPVTNIWEAVYHLSAERIGHGLKLDDNKKLLSHFLDRKITVELCPSSNYQIVGYKDNIYNLDEAKKYPLLDYLEAGLKVCVNTDNPGISRTNFTKELLKAAQMTDNGLSLWDILILIRNGFKASFMDYESRRTILRDAEEEIINILNFSEILK